MQVKDFHSEVWRPVAPCPMLAAPTAPTCPAPGPPTCRRHHFPAPPPLSSPANSLIRCCPAALRGLSLCNLQVQSATGAVGASFKKLGASLSSLGRRKGDDAPGSEHVPQVGQGVWQLVSAGAEGVWWWFGLEQVRGAVKAAGPLAAGAGGCANHHSC